MYCHRLGPEVWNKIAASIMLAAILLGHATSVGADVPPRRIVSLNLCTDQILIELVTKDRIAALTRLSADRNVSAIADDIAGVRLVAGLAEEVLGLDPDLVLASPYSATPTVDLLRRLGKRIELVPFATDFDGIRAAVRQMATAVDEAARGEAIIARFDAALASAGPLSSTPPEALVYQVNGLISGTGSLADAALKAAGFTNQAARNGVSSGVRLALESIVARPPDLVVLAQGINTYRTVVSDNLRHPALARVMQLAAGMDLPMPLWLCGTPHVATAVELLSAARNRLPVAANRQ